MGKGGGNTRPKAHHVAATHHLALHDEHLPPAHTAPNRVCNQHIPTGSNLFGKHPIGVYRPIQDDAFSTLIDVTHGLTICPKALS